MMGFLLFSTTVTVDADLVVELHIPVSSISLNGIDVFRETLRRFSFPYIVNQTLNVTGVNMTTGENSCLVCFLT